MSSLPLQPPGPEAAAEARAAMAVCEPHEASFWAAAFTACSQLPGDPLGAKVGTFDDLTCTASQSLDLPSLNRVLGVCTPDAVGEDRLDRILAFYAEHGVSKFRIEIPQPLLNGPLLQLLSRRGLAPVAEAMAKIIYTSPEIPGSRDLPDLPDGVTARILGPDDRDDFVRVNRRAWGLPSAFRHLYSGSFGTPGLAHYGVDEAGEVVAVGSIYCTGTMGWMGFAAVSPGSQGRGYSYVIGAALRQHGRAHRCELLHGESRSEVNDRANPALRSAPGAGFTYVYDRSYFEPVTLAARDEPPPPTAPAPPTASTIDEGRRRALGNRAHSSQGASG